MRGQDLFLAKNGIAVMIVGLLGGFGWVFALLGEVAISPIPVVFADSFPGEPASWRAVHTGCLMNGIMALAIAGVMPRFNPSDKDASRIAWGVTFAIWANTVFYFANLSAPNRSLSIGDNALGAASLAGAVGYITALIGAAVLVYALIVLMRSAKDEQS